jgi:hypothetical protein
MKKHYFASQLSLTFSLTHTSPNLPNTHLRQGSEVGTVLEKLVGHVDEEREFVEEAGRVREPLGQAETLEHVERPPPRHVLRQEVLVAHLARSDVVLLPNALEVLLLLHAVLVEGGRRLLLLGGEGLHRRGTAWLDLALQGKSVSGGMEGVTLRKWRGVGATKT